MTEEAVQAIAQILTIEQHEEDEGYDEAGGAERLDDWAQPGDGGKSGDLLAGPDHRLSCRPGWRLGCSEIALQLRQGRLEFLNRAARLDAAHIEDLGAN